MKTDPAVPELGKLIKLVSQVSNLNLAPDEVKTQPLLSNRAPQRKRSPFRFVLRDSKSSLAITIDDALSDLSARTREFAADYPHLAARYLGLGNIDGKDVLVQEFIEGSTLAEAIRSRCGLSVRDITDAYLQYTKLTERASTHAAMIEEMDRIVLGFSSLPGLDPQLANTIDSHIYPRLCDYCRSSAPTLRFTHGDLVPENVILTADGSFRLVDFEFSERTHFWREELIRMAFALRSAGSPEMGLQPLLSVANDSALVIVYWMRQAQRSNFVNNEEQFRQDLTWIEGNIREAAADLIARAKENTGISEAYVRVYWQRRNQFHQESSIASAVSPHERAVLIFEIPLEDRTLKRLRLDPFESQGVCTIYEITLLTRDGLILQTYPYANLRAHLVADDSTLVVDVGDGIKFVAVGTDPQIYFRPVDSTPLSDESILMRIALTVNPGKDSLLSAVEALQVGELQATSTLRDATKRIEFAGKSVHAISSRLITEIKERDGTVASVREDLAVAQVSLRESSQACARMIEAIHEADRRTAALQAQVSERDAVISTLRVELAVAQDSARETSAKVVQLNGMLQELREQSRHQLDERNAELAALRDELARVQETARVSSAANLQIATSLHEANRQAVLLAEREAECRSAAITDLTSLRELRKWSAMAKSKIQTLEARLAESCYSLKVAEAMLDLEKSNAELRAATWTGRVDRVVSRYKKWRANRGKRVPASQGDETGRWCLDTETSSWNVPVGQPVPLRGWFVDAKNRPARSVTAAIGGIEHLLPAEARTDVAEALDLSESAIACGFSGHGVMPAKATTLELWVHTHDDNLLLIARHNIVPTLNPTVSEEPAESAPLPPLEVAPEASTPPIALPATRFPSAPSTGLVSVIVPIYNAADSLKQCLASLARFMPPAWQLILIDDCSPDRTVASVIEAFRAQFINLRVYYSEHNLGFVGTCNFAATHLVDEGNHVLLLNSDTQTTAGAFEEMLSVLNLSDRHAVVCPRSNNATLLTVRSADSPSESESLTLWQNLRDSLPRYSIIPTGVGFCMLIRHTVLRLFGLFDPVFGRGYNEENDFICRINRFGFNAVAANHAFVFHHESRSFGESRRPLELRNRAILDSRYPEYSKKLARYFQSERAAQDYFSPSLSRKRPHVLLDLSPLQTASNGTTVYCTRMLRQLCKGLAEHVDISIATNRAAFEYHKDFFPSDHRVVFPEDGDSVCYDLAFYVSQLWAKGDLIRLSRSATRILFSLFDVISLRCDYLGDDDRRRVLRRALELCDSTMTISDYTLEDAQAYFGLQFNSRTIYLGFDSVPTGNQPPSPGKVLLIGNHYTHKALREAAYVLRNRADVTILGAAGIGHSSHQCYESGKLTDEQMAELLATAEVHVYPSLYEGFGLPIVQAAALNRWIVAYNSSVNRELRVRLELKNLVLFDTFDELPACVERCRGTAPSSPVRTWSKTADEHAEWILEQVHKPIDWPKVERRWRYANQ